MRSENPTVYSTEHGRICPRCGRPDAGCICHKKKTDPAGDGVVRVARESKGRKGKTVTLVSGLALPEEALKELAAELKRACGSGGAVKDGVIELQGDHRDAVLVVLQKHGIKGKMAG